MNFAYTRYHRDDFASYLREHVKVRSELSYSQNYFENWGKWIEGGSVGANQLRQMRGQTKLLNLGIGGEFSLFKNIHEFEATDGGWGPFAGLGVQFTHYDPTVYSELGDINDSRSIIPQICRRNIQHWR